MLTDCKHCRATVDAIEHGSFQAYDPEMGVPEKFTLGECPRCSSPFLLSQNDWGDGKWDAPGRLYPVRDDFVGVAVPKPIRNAFAEASRCLGAKAFTACAIMCRKALEGVCHDHGTAGRTLVDRLSDLKNKGIIEGRLYEWSDELRLVGNEAAHDVKVEVSTQDAVDALAFTRAVLEYVYTFRDQFEQFKKRRNTTVTAQAAATPSAGTEASSSAPAT
jgi:hypothetical protein